MFPIIGPYALLLAGSRNADIRAKTMLTIIRRTQINLDSKYKPIVSSLPRRARAVRDALTAVRRATGPKM